jgi:1-acyl-sn-glycerol-3-phosphate acyltransferase
VALARALKTAREAMDCAREIRREPAGPGAIHRAERLVTTCERLGERLRMNVEVRGRVPEGACVIIANHLSYLDPLAVGWTLPVGAVAKSEIMDWPGVGEAVADLGVVFVERGSAHSGAAALRKMMRLLEAGVPVLVFPEGTTTNGEDVLPFSRGAFGAARLMRVPVVPATIRYDSADVAWVGEASLVPHAVKLHRHQQLRAELIFGPTLQPLAFPNASALAEATRQCIRSLLVP